MSHKNRVGALYRVEGRVQGVGYRWWTRQQALELGLVGSVKNLPDGTVEVFAVGNGAAVKALETRLRKGPTGSHVATVTTAPAPVTDVTTFEIL